MVNLAERLVYMSVISCVSSGYELQRLNYSFGPQHVSKFSSVPKYLNLMAIVSFLSAFRFKSTSFTIFLLILVP